MSVSTAVRTAGSVAYSVRMSSCDLLQQRDLGAGVAAGGFQEGERVGLHVQAAAAAAVARPPARVDGEMADLQREARTAGVQPAVEHERAADAAVPGADHEQVLGAAAGAVPVLGEGGEVDVVGGVARGRGLAGRTGDTGLAPGCG